MKNWRNTVNLIHGSLIMPKKRLSKENPKLQTQNNEFLATESIGTLLRKLAIPTIAAQLINMLYNIVDRIYIGHMPEVGALALTGVGVYMPFIMVITAFAMLIGSGGAPRASIMMGQKNQQEAERILGNCFALLIILSAVLTFVLLVWNRDFLLAFGASENTIEYAASYMSIYAIGTFFVQATLGLSAFITAQGFTKVSMMAVVIGAVTNIVLDPIFIYGFGMGVQGAALATVISQGFSCFWVIRFLLSAKSILKIKAQFMRIHAKIILPCLTLGLASFIMISSESLLAVTFNASLLRYGGDVAVGAMTIIMSVLQFAMLPLQGLAQGAQPISSYNYGARNAKRVKETFHKLLTVSLFYSTALWALIMLFPQLFVSVFTSDASLLSFTPAALRAYFGVLFAFGAQIACQMTFVSIGNAKSSIVVAVLRKFLLLIPLIFILPRVFTSNQTMAVFAAEPIADALAVTFTVILFSIQFRKSLKGIEQTV